MARPRQYDPDTALASAVDRFWQQGFEAMPMQQLCKAMGLNPGSVYGAYGDKRSLFLAALDRYIETVSTEAMARLDNERSGLAAIRQYFASLIDAIVDGKRRWGCLVTNTAVEFAGRDPEIARKVSLHFARLEAAFERALTRAHAAGEISDDGARAAMFLVCQVQGLNVLAKTKPPRRHLTAVVEFGLQALGASGRVGMPNRNAAFRRK